MSNNLLSLFDKIKVQAKTAESSFVYYNKQTGMIKKISPRKEESKDEILEITVEEAGPFLKGEKTTANFRVALDFHSKKLSLKSIKDKNTLGSYENILYNIPRTEKNKEVTITQNVKEKCWEIELNEELTELIKSTELPVFNKILFSITKRDDPNILYRNLYIDLAQLTKEKIQIPFIYDSETNDQLFSVYVNKYFDSYGYRITNG